MAKRRSNRKLAKMQPAITDLFFTVPAGGKISGESFAYIDTARELSKINRRLYSQSRMYGFQGLTFIWRATASVGTPSQTLTTIEATVKTAGNTWVVQNAHTKGEALWHEMQSLVLDDNPSVAGKWHDFKVTLDYLQTPGRYLDCQDGSGVPIVAGEWDIATYVMPQHEVDPATGAPLVADEFRATLIGQDVTIPGPPVTGTRSLVKAYQESRATVQPTDPNVPAGMETSFFNLLTDSGSQEPELAIVIQDEGDEPPYDDAEYVGAAVNGVNPIIAGYAAISQSEVDGRIGGFIAPCGLVQVEIKGFDQEGAPFPAASMPAIDLLLHVAPGSYKGVAAIPMGQ
jgi:hypothetical protein